MLTVEAMKSCANELLKIAATRSSMTVAQSRIGRRPMRVTTMLQKEKDGTLFKQFVWRCLPKVPRLKKLKQQVLMWLVLKIWPKVLKAARWTLTW